MKTWVKLYTEIIDDKKLRPFSWAERGILMTLIALAGRLDYRDENEDETGQLDNLDEIAWFLRCTCNELEEAVKKFLDCGILEQNFDGILFLVNYGRRQKRPPSAKPTAVSGRVRRHRQAKKHAKRNEDVTSLQSECNEDVTQLERKIQKDTDTEEKERRAPLAYWALAGLCRIDEDTMSKRQERELWGVARTLEDTEVTGIDITAFGRWWFQHDWRGKQGESPRPVQVQEEWGKFSEYRDGGSIDPRQAADQEEATERDRRKVAEWEAKNLREGK